MASSGLEPSLDLQQLYREAQNRWLTPVEICYILRNHRKFQISQESPNRPPSGSFFLFDRKFSRDFRKDGHKWTKRPDGKAYKEAHEKLKVGGVDALHCHYTRGEENKNFRRRVYWMLDQEFTRIAFVHYLEVKKGDRTSNSASKSFTTCHTKEPSRNTNLAGLTGTHPSLCQDADLVDSHQTSFRSSPESSQLQSNPVMGQANASLLRSHFLHLGSDDHGGRSSIPGGPLSFADGDKAGDNSNVALVIESQSVVSGEEFLAQCTAGYDDVPFNESAGHYDGIPHAAAIQIQKRFHGWKKRKEFLILRKRIVKIQAHVRGHKVRKQCGKVILRLRGKGSGLHGFRRDALTKDSSPQCMPSEEDAYGSLKEGRKQKEEALQTALTPVKSMCQYPEGQDQYPRLLTPLQFLNVPEGYLLEFYQWVDKIFTSMQTQSCGPCSDYGHRILPKASDMVLSGPNETAKGDDDLNLDLDDESDDGDFVWNLFLSSEIDDDDIFDFL